MWLKLWTHDQGSESLIFFAGWSKWVVRALNVSDFGFSLDFPVSYMENTGQLTRVWTWRKEEGSLINTPHVFGIQSYWCSESLQHFKCIWYPLVLILSTLEFSQKTKKLLLKPSIHSQSWTLKRFLGKLPEFCWSGELIFT